jgi:hypothetical protein
MSKKTMKRFDCVEFKRRVQSEIYEETKHLNQREQIVYFRDRARSSFLGDWWKTFQNVSSSQETASVVTK